MFMDMELSRRLERTEGMIGTTYSAPRNSVAEVGACTRDFEGTMAVFDGAESPLTQTFGLGMQRPVDDALLAGIEAFFAERGAPTHHEVSPFAGVETFARLVARGYSPIELSTVTVQELANVPAPPTSALSVRVIDPVADGAAWIETCVAGWATDEAAAAFMLTIARVNIANRSMTHYIVEDGGTPVGTGSMGVVDGVALLAGASTIPAARGRGAQALLLATRLHDARARGCDVAMMVASVGSQSQRNAERNGFRVAYTRTKWQLPASTPPTGAGGTR
ncbi:MAG TPA: GNAT family N-acetyltransferase [Kofleriaceae bacterium]|nr:GNAT family N-acetyltransferase [Kofleriaceae bacterium]